MVNITWSPWAFRTIEIRCVHNDGSALLQPTQHKLYTTTPFMDKPILKPLWQQIYGHDIWSGLFGWWLFDSRYCQLQRIARVAIKQSAINQLKQSAALVIAQAVEHMSLQWRWLQDVVSNKQVQNSTWPPNTGSKSTTTRYSSQLDNSLPLQTIPVPPISNHPQNSLDLVGICTQLSRGQDVVLISAAGMFLVFGWMWKPMCYKSFDPNWPDGTLLTNVDKPDLEMRWKNKEAKWIIYPSHTKAGGTKHWEQNWKLPHQMNLNILNATYSSEDKNLLGHSRPFFLSLTGGSLSRKLPQLVMLNMPSPILRLPSNK